LKASASNNHLPVPSWRLLKKSFCLAEKFRVDIQVMISRLLWSANPFAIFARSSFIDLESALNIMSAWAEQETIEKLTNDPSGEQD
jgi:hypothetical protein